MQYSRQSVAYKHEFQHVVNNSKMQLKVIKNDPVKIFGMVPVQAIFLGIFFAMMLSYTIYSRVLLSEITENISMLESKYQVMLSEQTRLEVERESKISLKNIEQKAKELGLRSMQDYQIEYVSLGEDDEIQVISEKSNWVKEKSKYILDKILSYIK